MAEAWPLLGRCVHGRSGRGKNCLLDKQIAPTRAEESLPCHIHRLGRLHLLHLARRDAGGSGRTCSAWMLAGTGHAHVRAIASLGLALGRLWVRIVAVHGPVLAIEAAALRHGARIDAAS